MADKKPRRFRIPEKDIDVFLENMRRTNPTATREMAKNALLQLKIKVYEVGQEDPEELVRLHKKLKKEKRMKTN